MTPSKAPGLGRVRLGELLAKAGVITDEQLVAALQEQKHWGGKLGEILVRMKFVTEDIFVRALSKQLGLHRADLGQEIPPEVLAKVPAEMAEEYEIVPCAIVEDGRALAVATANPINIAVLDHVRTVVGMRVVPYVAGATAIRTAIARLYQSDHESMALEILTNGGDVLADTDDPAATPPGLERPPTPLATPVLVAVPPVAELAQRREAAALKALVELLVQKGIISLDEYIARLKR